MTTKEYPEYVAGQASVYRLNSHELTVEYTYSRQFKAEYLKCLEIGQGVRVPLYTTPTSVDALIAERIKALEAKGECVDVTGLPFAGFSIKSLLSVGNASYCVGGICLGLKDGKVKSVSIDGAEVQLYTTPPSVDALIAEIDAIHPHPFQGNTLNRSEVIAILDKYRSAK